MTIYLEDEQDFFENRKSLFEDIKKVVKTILDEEKVPYESEISLTVVDKETIRTINKQHRQMDKATDVLSFPQIEPLSNGVIDWDNMDTTQCMNFDSEEIMLGDIVLCEEIAKEQAVAYGHSLEREVCFLVAHSMFHLLGYDHLETADETLMIDKQKRILDQLGMTR